MRTCTWQACRSEAKRYEVTSDGEVWADLCEGHSEAMETYLKKDAMTVLRAWIHAVGGPVVAAKQLDSSYRAFQIRPTVRA